MTGLIVLALIALGTIYGLVVLIREEIDHKKGD